MHNQLTPAELESIVINANFDAFRSHPDADVHVRQVEPDEVLTIRGDGATISARSDRGPLACYAYGECGQLDPEPFAFCTFALGVALGLAGGWGMALAVRFVQ